MSLARKHARNALPEIRQFQQREDGCTLDGCTLVYFGTGTEVC